MLDWVERRLLKKAHLKQERRAGARCGMQSERVEGPT